MLLSSLSAENQAIYLQYLKDKAVLEANKQIDNLAIDPQGRVLIEVSLTEEDWRFLNETLVPQIEDEQWRKWVGRKTTVSLDISGQEVLQNKLNTQLLEALQKEDDVNFQAIHEALTTTPKGSIIALQQEFHFHLSLATRVYEKAVDELDDKGNELQAAHQDAMLGVNKLVMAAYAAALKKAYKGNKIDLSVLNHELDLARKAITPQAHKILRDEIIKRTQVTLTESSFNHSLKELAEETTATANDLLHTDRESGLATWIEGSEITAHDRGWGEEHTAARTLITHQYTKSGDISPHSHPRTQIRVPSLDAKLNGESENYHIHDVKNKIHHIATKYNLCAGDATPPERAFVYNLYTSLYHTIDDAQGKNKQTQGARQIIEGAHRYNSNAINRYNSDLLNSDPLKRDPVVLCFVQNIPINGFGSALGYGKLQRPLVKEATLMSEMALLHTLYKASSLEQQEEIKEIIGLYKSYLQRPGRPVFFCQSTAGKMAKEKIEQIKNEWKNTPSTAQQDIVADATTCLKNLVANNLHFDKDYAKLVQSLSVFLEKTSIGGCKSANERAQCINGRVAVLDALLLKDTNDLTEKERLLKTALTTCARDNKITPEMAKSLKESLDEAFNEAGLQTAPTLISLADQGASAKAQVRTPVEGLVNSNQFEEPTLTNLHQSKSSAMQAHKGLGDAMMAACTDEAAIGAKKKAELPQRVKVLLDKEVYDKVQEGKLFGQVGHYKQEPEANHQFVSERLGSSPDKLSDAQKKLYKGIDKYEGKHLAKIKAYSKAHGLPLPTKDNPNFFREQFIHFCLSKKLDGFAIPDSGDPRKNNPERATIKLEELFGKEGAELYQKALKEERNSQEYMDAVFRTSTTHYEGDKWAQRPVVIVAGPSASGKSFAAQEAIKKDSEFLPKMDTGADKPGNDVVAVDGGIFREVSQMRKFAIRVANQQGFTGISDLHSKSSILDKAKKCIKEAVFATSSLGVVIPETFSNPLKNPAGMLRKIEKLPNTTLMFTRVDGEEPLVLKKTVGFMGSNRAWKTKDFDRCPELDLNSTEDLSESKAYGKQGFYWGKKGSLEAEEWYRKNSKDKLSLLIINDLVLKKPVPKEVQESGAKAHRWADAQKGDEGAILVSRRTFEAWVKSEEEITLEAFIKKTPKSLLIMTAAEQHLLAVLKQLEARLDHECKHERRPKKIAALSTAIKAINGANPQDPDSFKLAIDTIQPLVTRKTASSLRRTQSVLINAVSALEERYAEVKKLEEIRNNKVAPEALVLHEKQVWRQKKVEQEKEIRDLVTHLDSLKTVREQARALSNNSFTWLNGAFGASAQKSATALHQKIRDLDESCETLIAYLEYKQWQIEGFLSELPEKPSTPGVEQHRQMLQRSLTLVRDELENSLLPTQKILRGDPDKEHVIARDGLIDTVETAMQGQKGIQVFSTFTCEIGADIALEQKDQLFGASLSDEDEIEGVAVQLGNRKKPVYQMVEQVKEGMGRPYKIKNQFGVEIGSFLEERPKKTSSTGSKTEGNDIQLSAIHFPGGDAKTDKNARDNKIIYSFAMAIQLLATMEKPPSKENPLILDGTNSEAMRFIFTALMVLGDKSSMKFGAEAISVDPIFFKKDDELGYFTRYSRNSCYDTYFKDSTALTRLVQDVKELTTDKMGHGKDQQNLEKALDQMTKLYKEKIQKVVGETVEDPDARSEDNYTA
ncbi:hypothetical protein [Legionella maioricensis]|uniref:Uncharacterized protein n=1 Tax=Legionella maioricensis TaxID=2896528 RepID=A0A9X2I9V7_9GAMM|nr:hypothetical protein [Legionella maioricensis]MCL9683001.1 hypothetical protein [Legionella maioricensis]MCL9686349.1 hypothetical protein [Legionella maioricensis]